MQRASRNSSRLLVLAALIAIGSYTGCVLDGPSSPSSTDEDGLGMLVIYPPTDVWDGGKAHPLGPLRIQLYRLGTDSLSAFTQRPVIDDAEFDPVVSLETDGAESIVFEVSTEPERTLWRLFVESESLLGQTTFPLFPDDLDRTVRVVLAQTAMDDRNAVILYNGMTARSLSERTGLDPQVPTVIYPVGVSNAQSLIGMDLRFVLSDADSATIYVDPGSRLYQFADSDQLTALTWDMKRLDFIPDRPAYRLEFSADDIEGLDATLVPGSDILVYIVAHGTALTNDLCVHSGSAFFFTEEGATSPEVLGGHLDECTFPPMAGVTVDELDGVEFEPGDAIEISWAISEGWGDIVRIDLVDHGTGRICLTIVNPADNDGNYIWAAEHCADPAAAYRLRVTDIASGASDESDESFTIAGISTECLELVGVVDTPGEARCVVTIGDHAYVADGVPGLQVINVQDPTAPFIVGSVATPAKAWGVAVSGNHAYVAADTSGLQVVDISNPASPDIVHMVSTPDRAFAVTVVGDYAYVADVEQGLQIVNIQDPTAAFIEGSIDTPWQAWDVAIAGNVAYVADGYGGGLQIVDITDPARPSIEGWILTPDDASGVVVVGNVAFVADGESGLQVIDVQYPAEPSIVASAATGTASFALDRNGNFVFVADRISGIQVVDTSDPYIPVIVGSTETPGEANWVHVSGTLLYVADFTSGLRIIDASCYSLTKRR